MIVYLFIHSTNSCYEQFKNLYNYDNQNQITENNPLQIRTVAGETLAGHIWPDDNENIIVIGREKIAPVTHCENISNN